VSTADSVTLMRMDHIVYGMIGEHPEQVIGATAVDLDSRCRFRGRSRDGQQVIA